MQHIFVLIHFIVLRFLLFSEKNYFVAPKGFANARMESLQEMFGLDNRMFNQTMIDELSTDMMNVNYSRAEEQFVPYKENSFNFLKNALYGETN